MKGLTERWLRSKDYRRAVHCVMAAIHCLDFTPQQQMQHSEEEKMRTLKLMMPILKIATSTFMSRGDLVNAEKAASAGLKIATKLPEEESAKFRGHLHFNRGLVRGIP